jgi:hypothetical protein
MLNIQENTLLYSAYTDQSKIGWDQWLKGKVACAWQPVYIHDIRRNVNQSGTPHRVPTAPVWATKLIIMTWEYVRTCWKFRNDEEHGNNQDPIATQKDKLIQKILWMKTKITHFPIN